MESHEVANVFPLMSEREYLALKSDVAENGLKQPIVVHEGKIVDGRHRYKACVEVGVEPTLQQWDGDGSLLAFVVSMNVHRRHLTTSQRALLAAELRPLFEEEARGRQGTRTDIGATLRERARGKVSERAAQVVGVSPRSVESASKVRQRAVPELMEAARRGDVAISMAAKLAELPAEEQEKVISLKDKRAMREAAEHVRETKRNLGTARLSGEAREAAIPVLELLQQATRVLDGRDPEQVVRTFFEKFPFQHGQMAKELEKSMAGAILMCEVCRVWQNGQVKAV